jgi:pSer/pThr/pTyr-binding forkhead associated (FHA) protein
VLRVSVKNTDGVVVSSFETPRDDASVGRGPQAAVRIDDPSIEPLHARLLVSGDHVLLEPLSPVAVNGRPVEGPTLLVEEDRISIGRHTLVVSSSAAPSAPALLEPKTTPMGKPKPGLASPVTDSPHVPAPTDGSKKLFDIVARVEADARTLSQLRYPLMISRASLSLEEAEAALVYELGAIRPHTAHGPGEVRRITIGRSKECDIVVVDNEISKRHASIIRAGEGGTRWLVDDEKSTNGTFVDGEPVKPGKPVELPAKLATIRFGPKASFAFMSESAFRSYVEELKARRMQRELAITHPRPGGSQPGKGP